MTRKEKFLLIYSLHEVNHCDYEYISQVSGLPIDDIRRIRKSQNYRHWRKLFKIKEGIAE